LNGQTGRLSFKLASTMDSVAEIGLQRMKDDFIPGWDEDESFAW